MQAPTASRIRWATSYLKPDLSTAEFAKKIRKPEGFYRQAIAGVKHDLRQKNEVLGDSKLASLLDESQRRMYQESLLVSATSSAPVMPHFMRANVGLPLFPNSIYCHAFAGLSKYVMDKHPNGTLAESLQVSTYYRTAVSVEDLAAHNYSLQDVSNIVAKNFFMQYWANDPQIFLPTTRSHYPLNSHYTSGATDLGREPEMLGAKLYAYGVEGKRAPITILNCGDTGPFTDGNMSLLQHFIECREQGYDFPLIWQVNSNNSSISQRLSLEEDGAVQRIRRRFELMGIPGIEVTHADDVAGGIESMRSAVDAVRAGNGPRVVIFKYPFRPGGHASDASPAAENMLCGHFDAFKDTMVNQLIMSSDPTKPTPGSVLADKVEEIEDMMDAATAHALSGTNVMRRPEIFELSAPGTAALQEVSGKIVELDPQYVLNKGMKEFAGLGADIYSKTLESTMGELRAANRQVRYVHQENHAANNTDTRGGVYGELNNISDESLKNFVNLLPNEAQVAQAAAGFRAILPRDSVIFCKGPHTLFNEHAKDFLKYAAYRQFDAGEVASTIYLMDGGSLAEEEKMVIEKDGEKIPRNLVLGRVGEHHNTPLYSGYAFDPNLMLAVPMDFNFFAAMLPEIIKLNEQGRQILGFLPTLQYGSLHPAMKAVEGGVTLGPHDVMRINYKHSKTKQTVAPLNGRRLVVVSWGPDSRWVCKYLVEKKLECTQFIVNYIHPPNALKTFLEEQVAAQIPTEVVIVDPNPYAGLLGPIMSAIRKDLKYADGLFFSECTILPAYVPWGNGETLLRSDDLETSLALRGIIAGAPETGVSASVPKKAAAPAAPAAPTQAPAAKPAVQTSSEVSIFAPMEATGVQVRFSVFPGTSVSVDDVIAEMESDKSTIDITAPCDGILESFFVQEATEIDVTQETKIAKIVPKVVAAEPVKPSETTITIGAPVDAESAVITFRKSVGDAVTPDEIVAEMESDKATVEIAAPCAGVVEKILCKEGEEIAIKEGQDIFTMLTTPEAVDAPSSYAPTSTLASISDPFEPESIPLSKHQRQMAENMTTQPGDSLTFAVSETMDFSRVISTAKETNTTPSTVLLKQLAESIARLQLNKKLTKDRQSFMLPKTIDLGLAIEVDRQLRVGVIRDVLNKSTSAIGEEIASMVARGKYLSMADQDMTTVCYTLSSLGKNSTAQVFPTLIRGTTGIIGVGRSEDGKSRMDMTVCHATLTGSEGAALLRDLCK